MFRPEVVASVKQNKYDGTISLRENGIIPVLEHAANGMEDLHRNQAMAIASRVTKTAEDTISRSDFVIARRLLERYKVQLTSEQSLLWMEMDQYAEKLAKERRASKQRGNVTIVDSLAEYLK